jgi:hypothetical protein
MTSITLARVPSLGSRWLPVLGACAIALGCGPHWTPPAAWTERPAPAPFTVVDLDPRKGDATAQLSEVVGLAATLHQRPYAELTSRLCAACHWLEHGLTEASVKQAFAGTYLVRIDVDRWQGRLEGTGLDRHSGPMPAFIALSPEGRAFGEWADPDDWRTDVPQRAAATLAVFFHDEPLTVVRRNGTD